MMDAAGTFREERKNTRIITRISKINVKNLDLTNVWQKKKMIIRVDNLSNLI